MSFERALALESPDYLPHLLAHIAYSRSAQFASEGQQRPGAYVKLAVEERALGDPAFMPPAGLSFERALAWALRGGEPETEVETRSAASNRYVASPHVASSQPTASQQAPVQTSAGPQSPAEIWQATPGRLQLTLNKGVFDTWLRQAVLLDYAPEPETFGLGVPHAYARDFLVKPRISGAITPRDGLSHLEMDPVCFGKDGRCKIKKQVGKIHAGMRVPRTARSRGVA